MYGCTNKSEVLLLKLCGDIYVTVMMCLLFQGVWGLPRQQQSLQPATLHTRQRRQEACHRRRPANARPRHTREGGGCVIVVMHVREGEV